MDHSNPPPRPPKPTLLDYDGIKDLAESEAHYAADALLQKALDEVPIGGEITKELGASIVEIYRHTYAKVYQERLEHYENVAIQWVVLNEGDDDKARKVN